MTKQPYNVLRHNNHWERAPRDPITLFTFATGTLGLGTAAAVAFAVVGTLAVTAITSWAMRALAPKLDTSLSDTMSSGILVNAREATAPHDFVYGEIRKGGTITFYETTGTENKFLHMIIAVAGHEVEEIGDIYINDEVVTLDGNGFVSGGVYNGKIRINKHTGAADQLADADLVSETSVTSDFRGRGIAYLYVRLEYDREVFANGIPLITAKVKGKKVYDPRTQTTAYSNNAALCIRDYLVSEYGLEDSQIDDTVFSAAANVCDEDVDLAATGTQPRYTINGVVRANTNHGEVLNRMVTACAGTLFWGAGNWKLVAGAYIAPTKVLTLDDLRSGINITTRNNVRDQFNVVQGTFNDANERYITADYPPIKSATFIAEDGGIEQPLDLELPLTTDFAMAQRLAKLTLFRGREQITLNAEFGLSAFDVEVGEIISLTIDRYGWTEKEFEVVGWQLAPNQDAGDLRVKLTLRETSAAAFAWNAEEEAIISNNTNLPQPSAGLDINNLTVNGGGRTTSDGTFINTAILDWDDVDNAFLDHYEIEWKPVADSNYNSTTSTTSDIEVSPLVDGIEYIIRVRAVTVSNIRGAYSQVNFTGGGDTSAPNPPTNLAAEAGYKQITVTFDPPTAPDFNQVEVYEGTTSTFGGASSIGFTSGNRFIRTGLGNNETRYYWLRSLDYTGNASSVVGPVNATTLLVEEADLSATLIDTIERAGVEAVNSLPVTGDFVGQIKFLLTDNTLYRWTGSAWSTQLYTDIQDNSVTTDKIAASAVVASKIAAGAVTADKISVNELSAITAVIGTFASAATGERVVITDDKIEVYDNNNQIRVKIGNLT